MIVFMLFIWWPENKDKKVWFEENVRNGKYKVEGILLKSYAADENYKDIKILITDNDSKKLLIKYEVSIYSKQLSESCYSIECSDTYIMIKLLGDSSISDYCGNDTNKRRGDVFYYEDLEKIKNQ